MSDAHLDVLVLRQIANDQVRFVVIDNLFVRGRKQSKHVASLSEQHAHWCSKCKGAQYTAMHEATGAAREISWPLTAI